MERLAGLELWLFFFFGAGADFRAGADASLFRGAAALRGAVFFGDFLGLFFFATVYIPGTGTHSQNLANHCTAMI